MTGFTSFITINVFPEDGLNAIVPATLGAALTPVSYPDSDSDCELVDSADGWTCCKCGYITAQEHTTCRKCDHGCCADCED